MTLNAGGHLTVRGKSHPWPFSTESTDGKAEVLHGRQPPLRAAADLFHSLLTLSGLVSAAALLTAGCGGDTNTTHGDARSDHGRASASASDSQAMRAQLVAGVVSILSSLDRYDEARGSEQVFDRLVQWSHAAGDAEVRDTEPMLATLPTELQRASETILARTTFDAAGDVVAIRDRCWLASVARSARRDAVDDLAVAEALFRWTVRSLAPVSDPPMVPSESSPGSRWFLPGEIMLSGRASGPQRAWIFIELLRQAGLDGVMLATAGPGGEPPRPWLPAVLIGGQAYLFEPTYGIPVPGPGGKGVATILEAASDPSILSALSLPERAYPVTAADARSVGVLVVADPWTLSRRMARLDAELGPEHGIHVAADTSVQSRGAAAMPLGSGASRGLWTFPWETVARRSLAAPSLADEIGALEMPMPDAEAGDQGRLFRPLFAGRVREFRGDLDGPTGAKAAYLAARPSRKLISESVATLPAQQATAITKRLVRVKEDATYWLGVVMLAEGHYAAAKDYLDRMTLKALPDSRWTDAARINLAAALIGLERPAEAAKFLEEDGSPQRFGSRLLAKKLLQEGSGEPEKEP